jgi:hypothetical protein
MRVTLSPIQYFLDSQILHIDSNEKYSLQNFNYFFYKSMLTKLQ